MRLFTFQCRNHPILGDLDLDFTLPSGEPATTVVIAGENGAGKSVLLKAIGEAAVAGHVNLQKQTADASPAWMRVGFLATGAQLGALARVGPDHRLDQFRPERERVFHLMGAPLPNGFLLVSGRDEAMRLAADRAHPMPGEAFTHGGRKFVMSEPTIDFEPMGRGGNDEIELDRGRFANAQVSFTGVGTRQIDDHFYAALSAIYRRDATALQEWVNEHPGEIPPADFVAPRWRRFVDAFAEMLPGKKLLPPRGPASPSDVNIFFEEHGREVPITGLSTGEKQIVFRGGRMVAETNYTRDAIVAIDEPENGLHPEWQKKILTFYRKALGIGGAGTGQIIVATHSPFIVHDEPEAKVIILRRNLDTGAVEVDPEPTFPVPGPQRLVEVFKVNSDLTRPQEPIVYTEGKRDTRLLELAWEKLRPSQPIPFVLNPTTGASDVSRKLNNAATDATKRLVIGVFDYDDAWKEWNGVCSQHSLAEPASAQSDGKGRLRRHTRFPVWAMLLPIPPHRSMLAGFEHEAKSELEIELLFRDGDLPGGLPRQRSAVGDGAGRVPFVTKSDKEKIGQHAESLDASAFAAFDPLLERIENIIAGRVVPEEWRS